MRAVMKDSASALPAPLMDGSVFVRVRVIECGELRPISRKASWGSSEKEWRSGLLLALRGIIAEPAAAAAAASRAPVRVDMVRVKELLELVERCD